jgi:hypothetical protein
MIECDTRNLNSRVERGCYEIPEWLCMEREPWMSGHGSSIMIAVNGARTTVAVNGARTTNAHSMETEPWMVGYGTRTSMIQDMKTTHGGCDTRTSMIQDMKTTHGWLWYHAELQWYKIWKQPWMVGYDTRTSMIQDMKTTHGWLWYQNFNDTRYENNPACLAMILELQWYKIWKQPWMVG